MPTVEEMRVVMDAETARLHRKLNEADRRMAQFQRDTAERLRRFDGYFRSAGGAVAALTAGLGTANVLQYADAWKRLERTITASEDIFGMRLHSSEDLLRLANDARVDLDAYTKTYTRTAAAIRDYGMTADDAAKITSTLSMALKLGATTAAEQTSVLLQFSQALNKGKLDGDEFRTVMEAAPVVVELLSSKLKISKGEIIDWAKEGKLKVKDLTGALIDGGAKIERIFRQAPVTMDEAFTVLSNAVTGYVGRLDKATGATQGLAGAIGGIARNIDTVGNSALVLSAAILAAFGPRMIAGVASFGVAAATAVSPLALIAGIVGGGAAALQLFGDQVTVSADGMVTLKDTAAAIVDVVGAKLTPMLQQAGVYWAQAVDMMTRALDGLPVQWEDILAVVRRAANFMLGVMSFAAKSIAAAFQTLPAAIGEAMIATANGVIATVEGMVRRVAETLNAIPGITIDATVDLGRITNPLDGAGAAAKQAMASAGDELGRDFVGEFGKALDGIGTEIAERARQIAELRRAQANTAPRDIEIRKGKPPVDKDLLEKMKKAEEELRELHRKSLEAAGRYTEAVGAEYIKELKKFQEMLDKKLITQEQFELARQRIAMIAAKEMNEALEKEWKRVREVTDVVASSMEDAFSSFTDTGKLNFREMTRSMLADLAKLMFRMAVIKPLFGESGQGFGFLGTLLGGATNGGTGIGSWSTTTLPGFANGGRPTGPSWVGERGRELFIPDAPGTIVPNHKLGGLGSTTVGISLSIDARGATRDAIPALERQLADLRAQLPRMIIETVAEGRDRSMIR